MRASLLLVLTTLAMFADVVSSIDNMPRARAARPSPRPSPKLRPSAHWPARPASPNTKRAPQHWSPPSPRPSPRPPAPSPKHHHGHGKRSEEDQDVLGGGGVIIDASHEDQENEEKQGLREGPCPEPLTACRVRGALDVDAFECVDLWADLSSCGGCPADDIIHDCAAIAHARGVECVAGHCEVRWCNEGYVVALQQDACVPVRGVTRNPTT